MTMRRATEPAVEAQLDRRANGDHATKRESRPVFASSNPLAERLRPTRSAASAARSGAMSEGMPDSYWTT